MYTGPLDPNKMTKWARKAYQSWAQQAARSRKCGRVIGYSSREFVGWWLTEMRHKKNWKCPTVSRKNHNKGYIFSNIKLEEKADNIRERNTRCGNPASARYKAVIAVCAGTRRRFESKSAAATFYNVSAKTVFNHCQNKTTKHFKYGPKRAEVVRFQWA